MKTTNRKNAKTATAAAAPKAGPQAQTGANPAPDLPYVTAVWHYAQAMAALRQGRMQPANEHYASLAKLAADPVFEKMMV